VTAVRGRSWVEGARVSLVSGGVRRTALTDAEGHFRIADLAAGPAHLAVAHPDYAEAELDFVVTPTGRADRPQTVEPVDLDEPGSVEGEVVDHEGEPVSGARVAVGVVPTFLPTGALPASMAQTDANGRFTLPRVAPGRRTLEALSAVSGRGRATGVEVTAGRVTDRVRIVLTEPVKDDPSLLGGNVAVTLGERGAGANLEIVVATVTATSEAERAGFAAGDVVVHIAGVAPRDMADARRRFSGRPGTDLVIEVRRDEHTVVLRVERELLRK
jgi:membrane-associated protease RseP (regulator of RpoE activity)